MISAGISGGRHARQTLAQTLTWQGAYVVAELGITAPRTKSDDQGRFTDVPTVTAISSLTERLLDAAAMPATALVDVAGRVIGSLGIDTAHLTPALRHSTRGVASMSRCVVRTRRCRAAWCSSGGAFGIRPHVN